MNPNFFIAVNVQTIDLPILIDIIRKTLPEGVQLSIHENKDENQEARYALLDHF